MSISGGRSRKSGAVLLGAVASLALVLAACGGGDGGGGGGDATEYEIQVAIANETTEQMTIRLDDGEAQTLETCTGNVFIFSLPRDERGVRVGVGQIH